MNNKDVLEILKRTYSEPAPDIIRNLRFDEIETEEVKSMPIRKKYYTAIAIYAAACLVVICVLPFIISGLRDPDAPTPAETGAETTVTETDEPVEEAVHDFGGAEFKFLHMGKNKQRDWSERWEQPYSRDVYLNACDWSSEIMNEAVTARNEAVEHGCNVELVFEAVDDTVGEARMRIRSGQCDFHAILAEGISSATLVTNSNAAEPMSGFKGYLMDLRSIENIDFTKSYWLPETQDELTIADQMFVGGGMITMDPYAHSDVLYFNRGLMDELDIEYPYELVQSGEWTYDKFIDMLMMSEKDLNNDGELYFADDRWCGVYSNYLRNFIAEAVPSTRLLEDGTYEFVAYTDKTRAVYDKYVDSLNDYGLDAVRSLYSPERGFYNVQMDYQSASSFKDDRALFMWGDMDYARRLDSVDYGLVPVPVLEVGDEYISRVSGNSNMISVPKTNPDIEMTGAVLDYMAKVSEEMLLPAYIKETLGSAEVQDERNYEMFEIIRDSIRYDRGELYLMGKEYDYMVYRTVRDNAIEGRAYSSITLNEFKYIVEILEKQKIK